MNKPLAVVSSAAARVMGMLAVLLIAAGALSCQNAQNQDIPNRVLDRPMDLELICARRLCDDNGVCRPDVVSFGECTGENASSTCTASNHVFGFVSNSERNEVAVFSRCRNNGLLDLDEAAPGYNFIPTGNLPTDLTATEDGCRVISSNRGSCDMTVMNAEQIAGYAMDIEPTLEPSALVRNVVPKRFDDLLGEWVPIGSRPADILGVPDELSGSVSLPGEDPNLPVDACQPGAGGSVYTTFPTCNLVAEIDLLTGNILQSLQFIENEDGTVDVLDAGVSPECPVDCPALFDEDTFPADPPVGDADGVAPAALELVKALPESLREEAGVNTGDLCFPDSGDQAVVETTLFVGGQGSEVLFEVRLDQDSGAFLTDPLQLQLREGLGIERIRASPGMVLEGDQAGIYQFLYVVAADGSTRVVSRDLDPARIDVGIECETQPERSAFDLGNVACIPVTQTPAGIVPPDRRAFARGPGIRPGDGSTITDWSFQKGYELPSEGDGTCGQALDGVTIPARSLEGYGVTTFGSLVQARFYFEETEDPMIGRPGELNSDTGPLPGLVDVSYRPHMLLGVTVPDSLDEPNLIRDFIPRAADSPPARRIPNDADENRRLTPGVRLIDTAYIEEEQEIGAFLLGVLDNADRLGITDEPGVGYHEDPVPRIMVRDYRAFTGNAWALEWEGEIPTTLSATGRVLCDNPSGNTQGGTCLPEDADDSRLVDDGADFCAAGVQPGDKIQIIGCENDNQCGPGQRCLLPTVSGVGNGICVSEQAFDSDAPRLREICADFIDDPCGDPIREYRITRAFQTELWLQGLDIDPQAYLQFSQDVGEEDEENCFDPDPDSDDNELICYRNVTEAVDTFVCTEEQPEGGCNIDEECQELLEGTEDDPGGAQFRCIDEVCRRPCGDSDECLLRRLPGPACFAEFVRYRVAADNAFIVRGSTSATDFISDRVRTDPDTGECVPVADEDLVSNLLTSRIPLGPDVENLGLPLCPTDDIPGPGDPNPCLITSNRGTGDTLFHQMEYGVAQGDDLERGAVVAVRYSNPLFSIIIDLVDLTSLTNTFDDRYDPDSGRHWPDDFRAFNRARIPRGYAIEFATRPGYQPRNTPMGRASNPVIYPTVIKNGTEPGFTYIVDSSGLGTSSTAIRGQVVRYNVAIFPPILDDSLDGVR